MFSTKLISASHVVLEKVHWHIKSNTIWRVHILGTPTILFKREKESQDKEEMTRLEVTPTKNALLSIRSDCFRTKREYYY